MKTAVLALCLFSATALAQSPEAVKYSPFPILLVNPEAGGEGVAPMVFAADGQKHLEFVLTSQIKDSLARGGQPIRLGDLLSLLSQNEQTISNLQTENARLQAENEKLWKVAMNGAPRQPSVVVQQPAPQDNRLERYMLLRSLLQPAQPYQLPTPVKPNANRLRTNCVTTQLGSTSTTNCN